MHLILSSVTDGGRSGSLTVFSRNACCSVSHTSCWTLLMSSRLASSGVEAEVDAPGETTTGRGSGVAGSGTTGVTWRASLQATPASLASLTRFHFSRVSADISTGSSASELPISPPSSGLARRSSKSPPPVSSGSGVPPPLLIRLGDH